MWRSHGRRIALVGAREEPAAASRLSWRMTCYNFVRDRIEHAAANDAPNWNVETDKISMYTVSQ
jgi:hypothetical protein